MKLKDKRVLITGGTTGIGFATAQLLIEEGAHVIVTGKNPETLAQGRATLGASAEVHESDAADIASIERLFAEIASVHGTLDALFVNAGIAHFAPMSMVAPEFFDWLFGINVRGAYFTLKHAIPLIADGGAIVINSSVASVLGMRGASVYGATKAALSSIGRTMALELAPRIRVNVVSPGPIDTPIYTKTGMPADMMSGMAGQMLNALPLKRFGNANEVAKAVLFLLSSDSSFMTGEEMFVDGGQHIPAVPISLGQ